MSFGRTTGTELFCLGRRVRLNSESRRHCALVGAVTGEQGLGFARLPWFPGLVVVVRLRLGEGGSVFGQVFQDP